MSMKELDINQELAIQMYNYYLQTGASVPEDLADLIEGPAVLRIGGTLEPGKAITLPESKAAPAA